MLTRIIVPRPSLFRVLFITNVAPTISRRYHIDQSMCSVSDCLSATSVAKVSGIIIGYFINSSVYGYFIYSLATYKEVIIISDITIIAASIRIIGLFSFMIFVFYNPL